jgi:hypothetical protein
MYFFISLLCPVLIHIQDTQRATAIRAETLDDKCPVWLCQESIPIVEQNCEKHVISGKKALKSPPK